MAKFDAIQNAARFAAAGKSARDKATLLHIGLLNQLGTHRTGTRKALRLTLQLLHPGSESVSFEIKINGKFYHARFRTNDLADYQTVWECFFEMYERPSCPIEYLIDGGANIGLFTIAAIATEQPAQCIAIEPDTANLDLLRQNVAPFPNVTVVSAALAGHNGTARFTRVSSNAGYLTSSKGGPEHDTLLTVSLPSLIPPKWDMSRTWLKLDIEGAEYVVIPDLLKAGLTPAVITAEIHDFLNADGEKLLFLLQQHGYSINVKGSGDAGYVCRQVHAVKTYDSERILPLQPMNVRNERSATVS